MNSLLFSCFSIHLSIEVVSRQVYRVFNIDWEISINSSKKPVKSNSRFNRDKTNHVKSISLCFPAIYEESILAFSDLLNVRIRRCDIQMSNKRSRFFFLFLTSRLFWFIYSSLFNHRKILSKLFRYCI